MEGVGMGWGGVDGGILLWGMGWVDVVVEMIVVVVIMTRVVLIVCRVDGMFGVDMGWACG